MVHADAANFASDLSKEQVYDLVLLQAESLVSDQRNWVCNSANIASLLWHAYKSLPEPSSHVNWAGFYTLDRSDPSGKSLILGPFQGKIACQAIAFGRGVCGTAAQTQKTQLVPNVDEFPGHIACDSESKSEIVVPITVDDPNSEGGKKVVAIIDVDCAVENGFDEVDAKYLGELADLLARGCDW